MRASALRVRLGVLCRWHWQDAGPLELTLPPSARAEETWLDLVAGDSESEDSEVWTEARPLGRPRKYN